MARPTGMTTAERKADVEQREAVTADRRNRLLMKKAQYAAAAAVEQEVSCRRPIFPGRQPAGPFPHGVGHQIAPGDPHFPSPTIPSPGWGYVPSPEYVDDDVLGGFKPNITFPRTLSAFSAGHPNAQYVYMSSLTYFGSSATVQRGPLPFVPAPQYTNAEAEMEDIINTGSTTAASCPGFGAHEKGTDDMDDAEGDPEEEEAEEEEEDTEEELEEEESVPTPTKGKGKKKRKTRSANSKPGKPRIKWTSVENVCLAEAWKLVSMDPITGANQNTETYWKRIKAAFVERKLVDPEFSGTYMDRGTKGMSNHWTAIQTACNRWHGIQEQVHARPESGASGEQQMVRMFEMFRRDAGFDFKFLHVFTRIESCEKWAEVQHQLADKDGSLSPNTPVPGVAEGRPDGNKKAKRARNDVPAAERLQASIEQCIIDAKTHSALREEKTEARWSALLTKQDAKLDLLRTNVAAKKRNTDLAFLMGGVTMDMDPLVKAWYLTERDLILNRMSTQPPAPPTPPPSPPLASPRLEVPDTPTSPTLTAPTDGGEQAA